MKTYDLATREGFEGYAAIHGVKAAKCARFALAYGMPRTRTKRTDPPMSFWKSYAVAEAHACNDETIRMVYRMGAANGACLSGIVFA